VTTLVETLRDPERKRAIIADGVLLIDREVASKRGISGRFLRAGYTAVRTLVPQFTAVALERLLPDFAPAVDPHYAEARESGDVKTFFVAHAGDIADSLLEVTDGKARRAQNRAIKSIYEKLRGRARDHVVAAMPGLAELVTKHVP
jgi:hypothetical protein